MSVFKDFNIDESRGDLYRQAIVSAQGYPDQAELRHLYKQATGHEALGTRDGARARIAKIAMAYSSENIALAIKSTLKAED